jgi:hypothetical protein
MLRFFANAMTHHVIAPLYGEHKLKNFFSEMGQRWDRGALEAKTDPGFPRDSGHDEEFASVSLLTGGDFCFYNMELSRAILGDAFTGYGEVSEWLKEAVSKTVVRATPVPWVRIPPSPP